LENSLAKGPLPSANTSPAWPPAHLGPKKGKVMIFYIIGVIVVVVVVAGFLGVHI
jgi:hypothetical protein